MIFQYLLKFKSSFQWLNEIYISILIILCICCCSCTSLSKDVDPFVMEEITGTDSFFEIIEPKELAYTYKIRPAGFGTAFNSSLATQNRLLVLVDPIDACKEILNVKSVRGNVAFVRRGSCSFLSKAVRMENAGATAVIVSDYKGSDSEDMYVQMVEDESDQDVSIPVGFLLGKNGMIIDQTLRKLRRNFAIVNLAVNVTNLPIHKFNQPPWIHW